MGSSLSHTGMGAPQNRFLLIDQSRAPSSHLPKAPSRTWLGIQLICWWAGRVRAVRSVTRADSERGRLNAAAGSGPVEVSPLLLGALRVAAEMFVVTGGHFDPTVLRALEGLGYDRTFRDVVPVPSRGRAPRTSFAEVVIDADGSTVELPPGVGLDLGGVGKGLAVDRIAHQLVGFGAVSVCISLGGDIVVRGPGPGADASWPIPVRESGGDRLIVEFPLVDEAVVQSTTAIRRWRCGDRTVHHIVDPGTGDSSATDVVSAIVTGPSAARAECVAKAAVVAGRVAGMELIEASGHDGWVIDEDGVVWATPWLAEVGA